jgi:DNA-binding CsgD family transcriptional regulator
MRWPPGPATPGGWPARPGDFEALGATLLAAEAASGAAAAFSRAGDRRAATAAQRRASALGAECEGAVTPGLVREAAVPLSGREREIAMLAAEGMTSKDIAERLYLSVRTVNNHLQHAYAKLGVSSRAGLARALRSGS